MFRRCIDGSYLRTSQQFGFIWFEPAKDDAERIAIEEMVQNQIPPHSEASIVPLALIGLN